MITEFKTHMEKLNMSKATIRNYVSDLRNGIKRCIISEDLSRLNMGRLFDLDVGASTKRRIRASIRKYAKFLVSTGELERVPAVIEAIDLPQPTRTLPKITRSGKVNDMINSTKNIEIKLILSIMQSTAARISSVCGLQIEDFEEEGITFLTAKGSKPYVSILTEETKKLLKEYVKEKTTGILFKNIKGKQHSPESLRNKLRRALGDNYVPAHSIRVGAATELAEKNVDVFAIQQFLNHSSIATTNGYIQMSPEVLRKRIMVQPS